VRGELAQYGYGLATAFGETCGPAKFRERAALLSKFLFISYGVAMALSEQDMLIRVPESEYEPLLNREKAVADVKTHLHRWTDLVHDITSYGSNLIPRCFTSSERKLKDVILIGVLLRQVVAMLDGIDILLSNGATYAAHLQMRALFEAAVYIDWILQGDSEKKIDYFYVHNLRRKRSWAARTQPGLSVSEPFQRMMNEAGVPLTDAARKSSAELIEEIDRVLAQPRLAEINQHFEQWRKKKGREVPWYLPLGPLSFAAVARAVKREAYYTLFYAIASEVMHSSSYDRHIKLGTKLTIEPIRWMDQFQPIFHFGLSMAMFAFMAILKAYRPGDLSFHRKYVEKWKRDFLDFPKIVYKSEVTEI